MSRDLDRKSLLFLIVVIFMFALITACDGGGGGGGDDDDDGGGFDVRGSVTYTGDWTGTENFTTIGFAPGAPFDLANGNLSFGYTYNSDYFIDVGIKTTSNTPGVYPINDPTVRWGMPYSDLNSVSIGFSPKGAVSERPVYYEHWRNTGNITITRFDQDRIEGTFTTTFEEYDSITLLPTGVQFNVDATFSTINIASVD